MNWWEIGGWIIVVILIAGSLTYVFIDFGKDAKETTNCYDEYPLDSCELYKCKAKYSSLTSGVKFNLRNYEICKIIINKNMSFNESLDLLEVITYEN